MRISRFVIVFCVLLVAVASPAFAQEEELAIARVAPTTGKFTFSFTITATSVVPKNGVIVCTANVSVNEATGQSIQQKASGIGTLSNGKWLCTATLPYSWVLATPTKDTVFLSYAAEIDYALAVTASNGTQTTVVPALLDKVNQNLGTIPMPGNAVTTTETITATI